MRLVIVTKGRKRALWSAVGGAGALALVLALTCCQEDEGSVEAGASSTPWTVQHDGIECTHPKAEATCNDGWCEIPAGCFLMGSPESEPYHSPDGENLTAVILTHAFVMQQTEVTQAQWGELVADNPSGKPAQDWGKSCLEPNCPVDMVSWQEILAFANLMSKRDGFEECYELVDCTGELGRQNFECGDVRLTTNTTYGCKGYRLPTEAEWEYAARAGTRTTFYSGELGTEFERVSTEIEVPILEQIAWYGHNAQKQSHPVASKEANPWGLHDMIGNVQEATSWLQAEPDRPGPLTDPQETLGRFGGRFYWWLTKGGTALDVAVAMRPASAAFGIDWKERGILSGFRLVRSLAPSSD